MSLLYFAGIDNKKSTSTMEVHFMSDEEIIKMWGNRVVERLDGNGDVVELVKLIMIKDGKCNKTIK